MPGLGRMRRLAGCFEQRGERGSGGELCSKRTSSFSERFGGERCSFHECIGSGQRFGFRERIGGGQRFGGGGQRCCVIGGFLYRRTSCCRHRPQGRGLHHR